MSTVMTQPTAIGLRDRARELASDLYGNDLPCEQQQAGHVCCLQKERERKPTAREAKKFGWASRPFDGYDPDHLCLACRAYWFVELAAQTLERHVAIEMKYGK